MDRMIARERDLRRENRELEEQVAATRTERLELRRQNSLAKLHLVRFARQLRQRIAVTLAKPYDSAHTEVAAIHALTDEIRRGSDLAKLADIPEFADIAISMLVYLEAVVDQQSSFRSQQEDKSIDQYVLDQRRALLRISERCGELIREMAEPGNQAGKPGSPNEQQ